MSFIVNKRIFYIDSHQRVSGSHNDFLYKLEIPPNETYDRVVVLSAMIPKSYYLIQSPYNKFTVRENGVNTVITFPEGNYTATAFKNQVQTLLNANSSQGWSYVVTLPASTDVSTGKFTFTVSGNGGLQPSFIFDDITKVYEQIGFDPSSTNTFVANSITSSNVIKMQPEDTLYIHSDICTNGVDDILQEVFSSAPDFSSIKYQCVDAQAYSKKVNTNNHNVYRFMLTDEDGRPINLNGLNMVLTILVYKVEDTFQAIKGYIKYRLLEK